LLRRKLLAMTVTEIAMLVSLRLPRLCHCERSAAISMSSAAIYI